MTNNVADCAMTIYKIMILLAIGSRVRWVGATPMKEMWQTSCLIGFLCFSGNQVINRKHDK